MFDTDRYGYAAITTLVVGFLLTVLMAKSCSEHRTELIQKSPVVETCVKHMVLQKVKVTDE